MARAQAVSEVAAIIGLGVEAIARESQDFTRCQVDCAGRG